MQRNFTGRVRGVVHISKYAKGPPAVRINYPALSGETQSSVCRTPVQITSLPMDVRTKIVRLENGGTIALSEYGDPRGVPVFFCHGWPSSRTMAELTHDAARDVGVRIISPDRPGIRDSDFQADRRLIDWPP